MLATHEIHGIKMKYVFCRKDAIFSELFNNETLLKVKMGRRRRNSLRIKSLMIQHELKTVSINQRKEEVHERACISRQSEKQFTLSIQ